ncbi:alkaline phosphatase [Glaciecola sp. 1036]|uniref:alkaline phosphatase n=1 Tax=Alteromonadaceae TaxID=72275 RepID=UPI003D05EF71
MIDRVSKIAVACGLTALFIAGCTSTDKQTETLVAKPSLPKNIIMVVADGMGPAYITAYRNYKDDPDTEVLEPIVVDDILLGTARTYPHPDSGYITDSAASATALATGVKTYNGAIGVDIDKQPLETVLHRARKYGMKTGLTVTSTIVHATPASYMVANEQRKNYNQIADSFFNDRIDGKFLADVMLGAGQTHFIREDRNIVDEFVASGFQYIDNYDQLDTVNGEQPLLGLFGPDELPWALDDSDPLRLSRMTKTALNQLTSDQGFFLLVEASQVDWAGHANDIASLVNEMEDFAQTISLLKTYVKDHPDTLVVITADHSTGGLTVAANGDYRWDPRWLKTIKASVETIAGKLAEQDDKAGFLSQQLGFELTIEEQNLLSLIDLDMPSKDVEKIVKRIIDKRTNTGWTTSGHTGVDVNIYGFGPGSERFTGNINNIEIAERIFTLLDEKYAQ